MTLTATVLAAGCTVMPQKYLPLVLGDQPQVVIHHFSTDKAGPEYQGETDFGQVFAEDLAGALQQRGMRAQVVPDQYPDQGARFIVDGDITRIHSGRPVEHFWTVFGADEASFAADIRMTDKNDSEKIFTDQAADTSKRTTDDEQALAFAAAGTADDLAKDIYKRIRTALKKKK